MKKVLLLGIMLYTAASSAQEGVWTSTVSEVVEYETTHKTPKQYHDDVYDVQRVQVVQENDTIKVKSLREYSYEEDGNDILMTYYFVDNQLVKTQLEMEGIDWNNQPWALTLIQEDSDLLRKLNIEDTSEIENEVKYVSSKGITTISADLDISFSGYGGEYVLVNKYTRTRINPNL